MAVKGGLTLQTHWMCAEPPQQGRADHPQVSVVLWSERKFLVLCRAQE